MSLPRLRLGLLVFLSMIFAAPSSAQYMYLDSNGDGVNTAADQVNPSGPTVIDIWLDTDSNRDGSAAVCINSQDPLNIASYVFVLRAVGGTITWGTFVNMQPQMGIHFLPLRSDTEFREGYGGFPPSPPGTYKLGALQFAVLSGSPSIQIVPGATGDISLNGRPSSPTSFGTACVGTYFENTYSLGADWSDVDGLTFGTGGSANGAPVLTQPTAMSVLSGETASQVLTASDPDRQPLTFSKVSGPGYVEVATIDPGNGTAPGKLVPAPRVGDERSATVIVAVTDGIAPDQKPLSVTVSPSPNHQPAFAGLGDIIVVAGTTIRVPLSAIDPDGQSLAFNLIDGPAFASVATFSTGPGMGSGVLRLAPILCDAGSSTVTLGVSDGASTDQLSLGILARIPAPARPSPPAYPVPSNANAIAIVDLNADGHLDVVTANGLHKAGVSTLLGKGDGTLSSALNHPVEGLDGSSIALGDFNADTRPDAAVAIRDLNRVVILLGRGDGSFVDGITLETQSFPYSVITADLDADGALDLAVANGSGSTASLFLGAGDGTFGSRQDIEMGSAVFGVAAADFNRDGRLDLAASVFLGETIAIALGFGDGSFGDRRGIHFFRTPFAIVATDWNWDGKPDLTVSDYDKGQVITLLGDGHGGFGPEIEATSFKNPQSFAPADFNGDGNLDLLVGDPADYDESKGSAQILYGAGDGSFASPRRLTSLPSNGVASGDLNADGFPDAIFSVGNNVNVWLNDAAGPGAAEARAFSKQDNHRFFSVLASLTQECIRLEPVAGSYQNAELNQRSIIMRSEGTGSVSEISAIPAHRLLARDLDRNGVAEVPVCFGQRDFNRLFDKIRGRQTVTAHIEGALANGRRFCTPIELNIVGHRRRFAASITPNPLNPQATMLFSTSDDGFVRIRMYDLNGRLVRTLLDQPNLAAGDHEVIVDGRGQNGARLASGVYFYEIEAQEGTIRGRMTVLK